MKVETSQVVYHCEGRADANGLSFFAIAFREFNFGALDFLLMNLALAKNLSVCRMGAAV